MSCELTRGLNPVRGPFRELDTVFTKNRKSLPHRHLRHISLQSQPTRPGKAIPWGDGKWLARPNSADLIAKAFFGKQGLGLTDICLRTAR